MAVKSASNLKSLSTDFQESFIWDCLIHRGIPQQCQRIYGIAVPDLASMAAVDPGSSTLFSTSLLFR
jgi:hypothetical protein